MLEQRSRAPKKDPNTITCAAVSTYTADDALDRKAFIIEDVREADVLLRDRGYTTTRVTYGELMSTGGEESLGRLLKGNFEVLWISTPTDWFVRPREKRTQSLYNRIGNFIRRSHNLHMQIIMIGPPGTIWKQPPIQEAIADTGLKETRMRLRRFNLKYDEGNDKPSGYYITVATNFNIPLKQWSCVCKCSMDQHVLDWYGQTQQHADWRKKVRTRLITELCQQIIPENLANPPPTDAITCTIVPQGCDFRCCDLQATFPTEARLRQKEQLKRMKAQGIAPKKRKKIVEPGNDD